MTAEQFDNLYPHAHKRIAVYKAYTMTADNHWTPRVFIEKFANRHLAAEWILEQMIKHGSHVYFQYYIDTEYRVNEEGDWHAITEY